MTHSTLPFDSDYVHPLEWSNAVSSIVALTFQKHCYGLSHGGRVLTENDVGFGAKVPVVEWGSVKPGLGVRRIEC